MKRLRKSALAGLAAMLWLFSSVFAHAQSTDQTPPSQSGDAEGRPRIGLVLSGGGARGAAHIGVLKVLEELRVPIDAIAGTSMGAVVGGLYASGLTAREIENVMRSVNWADAFRDRPPRKDLNFRRKQEDQDFLVDFPLGIRGGRILLPRGLIQGQTLNMMLRRLTMPVAEVENFDDLPTPFRAVATDLVTGDGVIIDSGDLTTAMRASLSAPGVFAPVERDGRLLVDGGITSNLPIDVARSMNVDVLIVVDVGFPLYERKRLNSAPTVSNQMLAILIRRDSERQRQTLTERDIIIDPKLGDTSSFDFNRIERAIAIGEEAGRAASERLSQLSISLSEYDVYARQREARREGVPTIEFLEVEKGSERYADTLQVLFGDFVGKPLDPEALTERVTSFYGRGHLEVLDYEIIKDESGRDGLALTARRNSWGPNYVRFGLNLQDDFEGNSSYNAAARVLFSEITEPGGEWVLDFQIGESPRVATEVYLPLSQKSRYFLLPYTRFEARNVPILDGQQRRAEFRVRTLEYGLDVGREFGNWGEIRAGIRREEGRARVRVGDPLLPESRFEGTGYFIRLSYDRLDDVNFPREGQLASLEWIGDRALLGTGRTADRLVFDWTTAHSIGRHTAVLWTSFGTTLNAPDSVLMGVGGGTSSDVNSLADVRSLFSLGGFFNLSGLQPNSITGPHFGIVRALFYRQVGRAGPGILDLPAYVGFSLEAGNVWQDRSDVSFGSARKNASLFFGVDSFLGPVYLGAGFDEEGDEAFYLFLGRTF